MKNDFGVVNFWNKLPKTAKVFVYIAISMVLSEVVVELGNMEDAFLVRISAGIINLLLVFLQESVPAVRAKLSKKE